MVGKVICTKNNIDYVGIRTAMCNGARTRQDLVEKANICNECEGCSSQVDNILSTVCSCKSVSLETVLAAVKNGANTVQEVGEITTAGTNCGRCQKLIANVIELGR